MPGHCDAADCTVVEGGLCAESPQNRCNGHECEDYHAYRLEPDDEPVPDDEDEGRALGFIETYPRTEE